jgi:DNA polymerase lambda
VKHPQLDLQPLYEVGFARPRPKAKTAVASATRIHTPNPPTSPIEEITVVLPPAALENQVKNKSAMSKTSDLCLEVKERVAKHSSIKQRDRLLKRGSSKMAAPIDESSIIYVSSSPSSRASPPIPAVKSALTVTSKQEQKTTKQPAEKRKGKEKPQPMTPTEYARSLNEKLAAAASDAADCSTSKPKKRTPVKFLEGKHIFYTGGDMKHASEMTRGRMDLVSFLSFFSCVSHYMF